MYVPKHFEVGELALLHEMMVANSFATLVTSDADGSPFATHLPLLLDRAPGELGTIRGHVARANPHWNEFDGARRALVIFTGPHGYISPSWYDTDRAVPTWNYVTVHAYGRPRLMEDPDRAMGVLMDLVEAYEQGREGRWNLESAPSEYIEEMARAIVAFEMPIERIEGKFKLTQNRPEDIPGVIAALQRQGDPASIALANAMLAVSGSV